MKRALLLCLIVAALFLLAPRAIQINARAQHKNNEIIAITNAKILTMAGDAIEQGTIIIERGRIAAVGKDLRVPANARRIDAAGKIVLPGIIDSNTHIGLTEVSEVDVTNDFNELSDPIVPQVRALDGFNPASEHIAVTRINGITSVLTAPGDLNVISGQSIMVRLAGNSVNDMLIKSPIGMHINFGEDPKKVFSKKNKMPETRMGIAALVRESFVKARNYQQKWLEYERQRKEQTAPQNAATTTTTSDQDKDKKPATPPDHDLKLDALIEVLAGKMPVIAHAERVDDILTAIRMADEFGFKIIIENGAESYKIATLLAARKIPVLFGPVNQQPDTPELAGAIYQAAAMLQRAGVKFAIQSGAGSDGYTEKQSRNLPFMAGFAVAYGLPYNEALKAITIYPAQILGVANEVGSIEAGKEADLVIYDGDPLEPRTHVEHLFIAGEEVPLRSYQTDLYDQYK